MSEDTSEQAQKDETQWWYESNIVRLQIVEGTLLFLTYLAGQSVLEGLGFGSHSEIIRNWLAALQTIGNIVTVYLRSRSRERIRWR